MRRGLAGIIWGLLLVVLLLPAAGHPQATPAPSSSPTCVNATRQSAGRATLSSGAYRRVARPARIETERLCQTRSAAAGLKLTHTSTPPPPTAPPETPDVSGTWSITRWWFRSCPGCGFPMVRTTTWRITQQGNELQVDRGLRGTIEGYQISLQGIETDGHDRYYFVYSTLHLNPDGYSFSGEFAGSETIQNPCDASPPIVTCLVHSGYLYAVRISPLPTPSATATWTPSPTPTPTATASFLPSATPTVSPTATSAPASPWKFRRLLPLVLRPEVTR